MVRHDGCCARRARLLLRLVACCCLTMTAATASLDASTLDATTLAKAGSEGTKSQPAAGYIRSEDMGITRCTLQGVLGEGKEGKEQVQLHVWLRMAAAPGDGNLTRIKGFAHLQSTTTMSVPRGKISPQLGQSAALKHLSSNIYLRSPYTRETYPLQVSFHGRQLNDANIYNPNVLSHVIDVWGALDLLPEDRGMDLELRVEGFEWHCNVVQRPPFLPSKPVTSMPSHASETEGLTPDGLHSQAADGSGGDSEAAARAVDPQPVDQPDELQQPASDSAAAADQQSDSTAADLEQPASDSSGAAQPTLLRIPGATGHMQAKELQERAEGLPLIHGTVQEPGQLLADGGDVVAGAADPQPGSQPDLLQPASDSDGGSGSDVNGQLLSASGSGSAAGLDGLQQPASESGTSSAGQLQPAGQLAVGGEEGWVVNDPEGDADDDDDDAMGYGGTQGGHSGTEGTQPHHQAIATRRLLSSSTSGSSSLPGWLQQISATIQRWMRGGPGQATTEQGDRKARKAGAGGKRRGADGKGPLGKPRKEGAGRESNAGRRAGSHSKGAREGQESGGSTGRGGVGGRRGASRGQQHGHVIRKSTSQAKNDQGADAGPGRRLGSQGQWLDQHQARAASMVSGAVEVAAAAVDRGSVRPRDVGPETEVWVVLAPYCHLSLDKYATLLWHHVLWHDQLGITRYLLYVTERLGGLLKEPMIEALVSSGVLQVVLYGDMSKHESEQYRPSHVDDYLMQVLVYNHALLALWGTDSLALVVDIDEYLVTAKPMTAVEVFSSCAVESQTAPVAGLQIQRRDAVCRTDGTSGLSCSNPQASYKQLWTSTSPADVGAGRAPHPMTALTMISDTSHLKPTQDTKALVDPNSVLDVHVHVMSALPGLVQAPAQPTCVRLVHLKDLFRWRPKPSYEAMPAEKTDSWWWPARQLQDRAKSH